MAAYVAPVGPDEKWFGNIHPADAPEGTQLGGFTFPEGHPKAGQATTAADGPVLGAIPTWVREGSDDFAQFNIPSPPSLDRFEHRDVPLPGRLDTSLDQLAALSASPEWQSLLSGKPNLGLLDSAVFTPARQQLELSTLPQTRDIFSSSPLGAGFQSGARRSAEVGAITAEANMESQLRLQAVHEAHANMLKAASVQAQQFTSAFAIELENDISNMGMEINTHFANQKLTQAEYAMEIQALDASLRQAGLNLQADNLQFEIDSFNTQMQLQVDQINAANKNAGWNTVAGIAGAAAGFMVGGPLGASAGYSIGSGAAQTFSGQGAAGMQNISSGISDFALAKYLGSLSPQGNTGNSGMFTVNTSGGGTRDIQVVDSAGRGIGGR